MSFVSTIYTKIVRDRELPLNVLLHKGRVYLSDLVTARVRLRSFKKRGRLVRTCGQPIIDNRGEMECGDQVTFLSVNSPAFLRTSKSGKIKIGSHVSINYGVYISSHKEVRIGSRVRIGPYAFFSDHETLEEPQSIVVGDDVWVGAKATILPGVRVGRGAVIGTHATVTEDVPDFCVVVGNPARIIRRLDPTRFVPETEV
jgi:acetyltransferase-like isoleucine patch superfamily enzyme